MAGISDPEQDRNATAGEGFGVVLFDDDVHEVKRVAATLMRVARMSMDQAMEATLKAENNGHAVITITTEERANEMVAQLLAAEMAAELRAF